jgi:hypothetical protein
MSDDIMLAYERAQELVGEAVWVRLSNNTRVNALLEELRVLNAERTKATCEPLHNMRTASQSNNGF